MITNTTSEIDRLMFTAGDCSVYLTKGQSNDEMYEQLRECVGWSNDEPSWHEETDNEFGYGLLVTAPDPPSRDDVVKGSDPPTWDDEITGSEDEYKDCSQDDEDFVYYTSDSYTCRIP